MRDLVCVCMCMCIYTKNVEGPASYVCVCVYIRRMLKGMRAVGGVEVCV